MLPNDLKEHLKFYFISDDEAAMPVIEQVETAILGGATMIQYRNTSFALVHFEEVLAVRNRCRINRVPFIINDDIVLAQAVGADGVHLGQDDASPAQARRILGNRAVIGISVSTPEELAGTDTGPCDYMGTGPVFGTTTKKDPKQTIGLDGLERVVSLAEIPVVAIGGITPGNAASCLAAGAAGVAVISCVTRSDRPLENARQLAKACGISAFPGRLQVPWRDEFGLIRAIMTDAPLEAAGKPVFEVFPGDDAAVLSNIRRPVISTDAHVEGVHFDFSWQTPEEVGYKSMVVTLSDLAASFARPVAVFVNLTLPKDAPDVLAEKLYAGLKKALKEYDCALGGGNVTSGRDVSLNLFAVGEGGAAGYPARSGARSGDGLYCTGRLGLAAAGLMLLQEKDVSQPALVERFKFPRARFDAAAVLAAHGVTCVIDVSDGLSGDAGHIAEASGLTIVFDYDSGIFDPELWAFYRKTGRAPEEMVFRGGEDYELLFTCDPEKFNAIRKQLPEAFQLGWCRPFEEKPLKGMPAGLKSFQHGNGV